MNRLTEKEALTIRSMGRYWEEVAQRDGGSEILRNELRQAYEVVGLKLLWILLDHAKEFKPNDQDWVEREGDVGI